MTNIVISFAAGAIMGCGISFLLVRWMLNRAYNDAGDL